jgi:Arc/MetJ-type ribon-helix-helix transcriptional regulator
MDDTVTITVRIPRRLYAELALRVPEGERSTFIREALIEKLQRTPTADKIIELQERIQRLEEEISRIKNSLADLEVLTYTRGEVNPHAFCIDEIDHKIINYLIHYRGATTSEIAEAIKVNRWLILNRLKRIQSKSKKQLGKPVVEYYAGQRAGKMKAWWLNEEITEEQIET